MSLTFLFQVSIIRKVGSSSLCTRMRGVSHDAPLSVLRTNKTVTSIVPTASADCCRRMKIPLRICSFHLFFSLLCLCVCVPLLFLSVDPKPRLRRATLLHKRGEENAGRPGNAPSPPALSSSLYSDPIVVCRIVSTTAGAAPPHTQDTTRPAPTSQRCCSDLSFPFSFSLLFLSLLSACVFFSRMRQGGRKGMRFWVVRWEDERVLRAEVENTSRKVVSRRRCDLQDRGDGGFLSAVERRDSTVFCFSFTSVPLFLGKKNILLVNQTIVNFDSCQP